MADVILRDLDDRTLETLERRARARGRTLEQELREIIGQAVRPSRAERVAEIDRIRAMTPRRLQTDSADLIREDRERRWRRSTAPTAFGSAIGSASPDRTL